MQQITKEHLRFLNTAKDEFENNDKLHTFMMEEIGMIALRTGADRDCIEIYELGGRVANFVQQLEKD